MIYNKNDFWHCLHCWYCFHCLRYSNYFKQLKHVCLCLNILLGKVREDINEKKTFSFRHCPNHLNPPWPQFGQLGPFFGRQNSRFESHLKGGEGDILTTCIVAIITCTRYGGDGCVLLMHNGGKMIAAASPRLFPWTEATTMIVQKVICLCCIFYSPIWCAVNAKGTTVIIWWRGVKIQWTLGNLSFTF